MIDKRDLIMSGDFELQVLFPTDVQIFSIHIVSKGLIHALFLNGCCCKHPSVELNNCGQLDGFQPLEDGPAPITFV